MAVHISKNLAGVFTCKTEDGLFHKIRIPGTLDENNIGHTELLEETGPNASEDPYLSEETERILNEDSSVSLSFSNEQKPERPDTRYARKYTYTGKAIIYREVSFTKNPGKRYFTEVTRARALRLFLNDTEIPHFRPQTLVTPHVFEITGIKEDRVRFAFVSDNTYPLMPKEEILSSNMASPVTQTNWNGLLGNVRIREEEPTFIESISAFLHENTVDIQVEISSTEEKDGFITFTSEIFAKTFQQKVHITKGLQSFLFTDFSLKDDLKKWDLSDPALYTLRVSVFESEREITFGLREVSVSDKIYLNGEPIYLTGETNYGIFPDTGYLPMNESAWEKIFSVYLSYGIRFIRFRSLCPPEEAFSAADRMGLILMVSLSSGTPDFPRTKVANDYFHDEMKAILRAYGNHPSFFFLSYGDSFIAADSFSNPALRFPDAFIGEKAYQIENYFSLIPRFPVLPDFRDTDFFAGPLEPLNRINEEKNVYEKGFLPFWKRFTEDSGETALRRYKEELEKAYINTSLSGFLLESLMDYPGETESPFGFIYTHGLPKPYSFANPKTFSAFLHPVKPYALLPRFTYEYGETITAELFVVNRTQKPITGTLRATIKAWTRKKEETWENVTVNPGEFVSVGSISYLPTEDFGELRPVHSLLLSYNGEETTYPIYVYRDTIPTCPENVLETDRLNEEAIRFLEDGGNVLLFPLLLNTEKVPEALLHIESKAPVFHHFETNTYPDMRWENICVGKGISLPLSIKPFIRRLPEPIRPENCAILFETRVKRGAVLVSFLSLKESIYSAEARALLSSIYRYMDSDDFSPSTETEVPVLQEWLRTGIDSETK